MNKEKPTAILIKEYNILDGYKKTINNIKSFFTAEGIPTIIIPYIYLGFIPFYTKKKNKKIAKRIIQTIKNTKSSTICIGNSNGCKIIQIASKKINIDKAIFINPALDSDTDLSKFGHIDIYHSPSNKKEFLIPKLLKIIKNNKKLNGVRAIKFHFYNKMFNTST